MERLGFCGTARAGRALAVSWPRVTAARSKSVKASSTSSAEKMLLFLLRAFCTRTPLSTSVCMALRAASRLRPVSRAADCMLTTGVPGSTSNKRSAADPLRGRTRSAQDARRHSMRSSKDRASPQASTTALQKYRMNASCAERSSSSSVQCKFSRASIYVPRFEAMDIDMGGRVRSMRPPDRRTSSVRALPVRPFPSANGWIDSNCA